MAATTAQLRKAARAAEARQRFAKASRLYTLAADRYPQPYPKAGALAERDVQALRMLAQACGRMVR